MLRRDTVDELLNLPIDERRRVVGLLQASIREEDHSESNGDQATAAAKWLLSIAGRYSGAGNMASQADEVLRAELGKHPQGTN